uniref:Putative ovule protein n=2 Tax=Solanum chacoense TaxID=4108 RepID=A0A0V0HMK5_SOLCH
MRSLMFDHELCLYGRISYLWNPILVGSLLRNYWCYITVVMPGYATKIQRRWLRSPWGFYPHNPVLGFSWMLSWARHLEEVAHVLFRRKHRMIVWNMEFSHLLRT